MENFLTHTDKDREQMLSAIGVSHIDELFDMIPDSAKFKNFDRWLTVTWLDWIRYTSSVFNARNWRKSN